MEKEKKISVNSMERVVSQELRAWADRSSCHCGKDMRRFAKERIAIYVFHSMTSSKGLTLMVNYNEVEDLDKSINRCLDHLNTEFREIEPYHKSPFYNCVNEWRQVAKNEIAEYKWRQKFNIEKVIFNNPATIVFWEDGTKTVVKRQKGDRWNKEKGLAMAIAKKLYGNTGKYCDILKEHLED